MENALIDVVRSHHVEMSNEIFESTGGVCRTNRWNWVRWVNNHLKKVERTRSVSFNWIGNINTHWSKRITLGYHFPLSDVHSNVNLLIFVTPKTYHNCISIANVSWIMIILCHSLIWYHLRWHCVLPFPHCTSPPQCNERTNWAMVRTMTNSSKKKQTTCTSVARLSF